MKTRLISLYHNGATSLKRLYYGERGEPIRYGAHSLRYVPGTRPVRLKYINSEVGTVRNDAKQLKFFLENIKPGEVILDVGGNVGQYAVLFASLVASDGLVVTFEPDQTSRDLLEKNLRLNGFSDQVTVESLALFDSAGTFAFFSKGGGDATASLARSGLGVDSPSCQLLEQMVETIRLDDYLESRGALAPDWIKLDTEGAEINILRGARKTLRGGVKVVCELHPYAWPEFGTTFEELLEIVAECGRRIEYLDESQKISDGAFYGATLIS